MNVLYLNGRKCPELHVVSLYNPSFLYGINCFEGIRAYWQEKTNRLVFLDLEAHLRRLFASMDGLSFEPPVGLHALRSEILSMVETEDIREDAYFRITVFIGDGASWHDAREIHYMVSARSHPSRLGNQPPLSLGISRFRRLSSLAMPPSVKAGANYLNSRYALLDVRKAGFDDALFLTESGHVSEGTGSTVFFVQGNRLYTPSADCDLLLGITRARIISLCGAQSIEVSEERIPADKLPEFEAAFLAGTMIEVRPIRSIGSNQYAAAHPLYHAVVEALQKHLRELGSE